MNEVCDFIISKFLCICICIYNCFCFATKFCEFCLQKKEKKNERKEPCLLLSTPRTALTPVAFARMFPMFPVPQKKSKRTLFFVVSSGHDVLIHSDNVSKSVFPVLVFTWKKAKGEISKLKPQRLSKIPKI